MPDVDDDPYGVFAELGEPEPVTMPAPRKIARSRKPASHRVEMRLPDLYHRFVEHESARRGVTVSELIRLALFQMKEWSAWEKQQQSPTAAPTRRDGRFAPEGVETDRARRERQRREKLQAEAGLYRRSVGGFETHYGPRDEILGYYTWEEALEEFRKTLVVPGPPIPACPHASAFDWQLQDILRRREEVYREAGVEPPDLPDHLVAYKAACPHGMIADEHCEDCGRVVPYVA